MELLHSSYVMVTVAQVSKEFFSLSSNISHDTNKKHQELKKEMSLEIQKLQRKINVLDQKTNTNLEYCKLQPEDICGPCLCKDDARVLKKYYYNCQNLQVKRDCLEHKKLV